jgi:signal transduction histidine kinase/CheY-like chemotaxis protein
MVNFSITLFVLGKLWFADRSTSQVRSLIAVGVATCFWIIFDAVAMISRPEVYGYFFTLRSIMLVVDPYCLLWFFLSLNEVPLLKNRIVNLLIFIIPAADILLLLSDPLHHKVFIKHDFPLPEYGPLFAFHSAAAYLAVALVIVLIFRFIIVHKPPRWVSFMAILFSLMPVVVNVLFTLHIIDLIQDVAPFAFFFIFLVFSLYAQRTRLLNFKATALADIFEHYRDAIIFADDNFIITDANRAAGEYFPFGGIVPRKTNLKNFVEDLARRSFNRSPEHLFEVFKLSELPAHAGEALGEFSISSLPSGPPERTELTFKLSYQRVHRKKKLTGYSVNLSDITAYRTMINKIEKQNHKLTELKRTAEEASQAKSLFLANMSHEIRTPLNAIIGLGELELRNELSPSTRDSLGKMQNSAQILLAISNDILDISKIESGKLELFPAVYNVPALLSDVVTINLVRIGSKPINFVFDIDENIPVRLLGDELRVRQVLNNFLSNAFKYTREGEVKFSVGGEGLDSGAFYLVCVIADTGIGIRPEDQARLFEDYYQADAKSSHHIEGTGLGLAISQRFVGMMDGTITVKSEYGKGSVFTVRMRQEAADKTPIGAEAAEALRHLRFIDGDERRTGDGPRLQFPGRRVLVVDDVEINLEVARGMMEAYGLTVDCVQSGWAAIDLIRSAEVIYDVIFMDHMMPGLDGIEAVRIIRNEIGTEYARTIPVIALTANALAGSEAMFLDNGFQAFLSKPIESSRLDELLAAWLTP